MPVNETEVQDRIKKQVDNEIAQKRQSINNSLSIQKKEFDGTINRNNQFLDEQIKSLNTSRVVNDDKIAALNNRRGGFYSGGLDYQLAENMRSTTSAQDNIRRDINEKNQGILGQYNTLASQAAENIRMLESQSPDRIREMVNAELMKQRELQMQEEQWALEKQLKQLQLQKAQSAGSGGGSRGGSRSGSTGYNSAESIVQAALKEIEYDTYKGMEAASPKLNPAATTGLASKPGSYWYARGYGSQYLPNNYGQSKGKFQTGVR